MKAPTGQTALGEHDATAARFLRNLLKCHNEGRSENDIRTAFRDFILETEIVADEMAIRTEVPPGRESQRLVDMYVGNTYIEFKTNIMRGGAVSSDAVEQIDDYLLRANQSGYGIQNGLLTDGKRFLKRSVGDHILPLAPSTVFAVEHPEQGHRLREYLRDILETEARDLQPSKHTLTKHLGIESDLLKQATALLVSAHNEHREDPEVAVKRKLWQDLLQVALGQDSAGDPDTADWLFVRHTYLITLTALILQRQFGIDVEREAERDPESLLNGATLESYTGLRGVIESDLFLWAPAVGQTQFARAIARKVTQFDWSESADELAATLYQNTITKEERKRLGEYYTPRWLAQAIVDELVANPRDTVTLDPACGSGTFIECVTKNITLACADLSPRDTLERLQRNVIGIDLHPVAVQLAKATWVLACHKVITDSRALGGAMDPIVPPIHLGDSMQLRYDRRTLLNHGTITVLTTEIDSEQGGDVSFRVPMTLARRTEEFDRLMLEIARTVDTGDDPNGVMTASNIRDEAERGALKELIRQMQGLHAQGRDHVWAYYLRNMVRPAVLSEVQVDAIVGNPPWLTFRQSADIVREEMQHLSGNTYGIWGGGRHAANQDIATLFYSRVADLYLRDGGLIGLVLPHSALRAGQHLKWRSGEWVGNDNGCSSSVNVDFKTKRPWDLDNLEPNTFFPMPSSVVFAKLMGRNTGQSGPLAPGEVEVWRGIAGSREVARDTERLLHDDGEFHSPYHQHARRGADIFDRRLYFVSALPNETMFALPGTYITEPRISGLDKKRYDVKALQGMLLHEDNLFDVYLGETVAPYVTLRPPKAALPIVKESMTLPLNDEGDGQVDASSFRPMMPERWETMCRLWEANKSASNRLTLTENLNWRSKLTSQLAWSANPGRRPIRIAYTTSGRPSAALIEDRKAILDTKLYQVTCRGMNEAYYLMAIINSDALAVAVKPFCTTNWARKIRDLHKHLWKLPIPEYSGRRSLHRRLARLGMAAVQEATALIDSLDDPTPRKVNEALRHQWQPNSKVAAEIESAVSRLLNT